MINNRLNTMYYNVATGMNRAYSSPVTTAPGECTRTECKTEKDRREKYKSFILPAVLLGAGGLLLYKGFTGNSETQIIYTGVKNRILMMKKKAHDFSAEVVKSIENEFKEPYEHIQNYKKENLINLSNSVTNIKKLNTASKTLKAQDLAFDMISGHNPGHTVKNREEITYIDKDRPGIIWIDTTKLPKCNSDISEFSNMVYKAKSALFKHLNSLQNETALEFEDLSQIPNFKDGRHSELLEKCREELRINENIEKANLEKIKQTKITEAAKKYYKEAANTIIDIRKSGNTAKEHIINATFEHIKNLIGCDKNIVPQFDRIPSTENFDKLPPKLKEPCTLPKALKEIAENNIYFDILQTKNPANLTEKDFNTIFYRIPYSNNLKDLGYLIDRLRIRREVVRAKNPNGTQKYDAIIAKLEFLSNKLHEFGRNKFVEKAAFDFENQSCEKRKASIYYADTILKRLGYTSLKEADCEMAKISQEYEKLNIRKYIDVISSNPDLYFV